MVDLEISAADRRRMGDRLRAARWSAGLSQRQIGKAVGRSATAARYWEVMGFVPDDAEVRAALATLLGIPERVLFAEYYVLVDEVARLLEAG